MAINDNDLLLINDSQDSNEAKKIKYSTLKSNINSDSGNDLQGVTDNGNTTTNDVQIGPWKPNTSVDGQEGIYLGSGALQSNRTDGAHVLSLIHI